MKSISAAILMVAFVSILNAQSKTGSDVESRVNALLAKMTLEEKIGQMTQPDYWAVSSTPNDIIKYSIGSIIWGGNTELPDITAKGWKEVCDSLQALTQKTRLRIPIIFGIDAVHGHNNVNGAVIFPHNIALGATRNPQLVEKVGMVTANEIKGTGIQWDFAPCIAVARNERWGRTYESYGEDPALVAELGTAYVKGMQGKKLSGNGSVLACIKHFIGDGGTTNGKDQGNTDCDEQTLRRIHLPGYIEAMKAGAKSIMVSFSSWNGNRMHGHKYLLTNLLKGELKFDGFLSSDWGGINQLPGDLKDNIEQSINAGLDMIMIPNRSESNYGIMEFVNTTKELVKENKISKARIDDAVRRILRVKFEMGLFENRFTDKSLTAEVGSPAHREVAREAVRQSLVLLKNDNAVLPLQKNAKSILVAGSKADDIGMQCGGWTINWQGRRGSYVSGGTTILQAIKNSVTNTTKIKYSADGSGSDSGDIAIVVIGEEPYAELFGDRENLKLSNEDIDLVEKIKAKNIPVIVVLLSGRPMIINSTLEKSNAFIAAWLPGTEGEGIADVLFGDFTPTGKLPHSWPRMMSQIPINIGDKDYEPLFPYGFGLTYEIDKAMK
jgi:beta-glucosidase